MGMNDPWARYSRPVLKSKRWKVLRHQILERDGWKCRSCGGHGRLEVDHIEPVRSNPSRAFDPLNLQSLCPSCHTRKTRIECGHPEKSPARIAWDLAVAELATKPNPAMEI